VSGRNSGPTPLTMRIRRAQRDDTTAIRAVVKAAYALYVPRIGREPAPMTADYESLVAASEVWVGETDGRVIGVLVIRASEDALELENVAVDPVEQGHGRGRELLTFAEDHARGLGLTAVELYTNEAMVENIALYPRLGYVETGRRVEGGYRRVYFRKSLDARAFRR
jgi:N-acetylglutamate synthase-like GNAT family acetyltransferase